MTIKIYLIKYFDSWVKDGKILVFFYYTNLYKSISFKGEGYLEGIGKSQTHAKNSYSVKFF